MSGPRRSTVPKKWPRRICPECGRLCGCYQDGSIAFHYWLFTEGVCPGSRTPAAHIPKVAATVGTPDAPLYVVECACGWSSALHITQRHARDAFRRHRATA